MTIGEGCGRRGGAWLDLAGVGLRLECSAKRHLIVSVPYIVFGWTEQTKA